MGQPEQRVGVMAIEKGMVKGSQEKVEWFTIVLIGPGSSQTTFLNGWLIFIFSILFFYFECGHCIGVSGPNPCWGYECLYWLSRAVDGADNSSGSFDAQGAFHGGHNYSDEEEVSFQCLPSVNILMDNVL